MAAGKKFGSFAGVFTPSLLTILGVIMYMRLGWVVGNAGLVGSLIIIGIAHVISITTGLSISSIATDKKIGAGGVYYVLSRSLGLPIGGAIGLTLFVGTALSIALYLVGFAESLNAYIGMDASVNVIRITGTIALLSLAAIALISTAVALKTQFFILAAIIISLIAIFFGHSEYVPVVVPFFGGEGSASMETVFAIFFPAVTGFTAGIAMSGDLRDPKRSIPQGTIAAIAVGFLVYVGLAVFIAYRIDAATLVSDNNILMKVALFAPAVVAGIWGATLSSALGGILGGPRILQAMSVDRITPQIFGRGKGKDNEPWNALFLTVVIAEIGILIGELDMIARVVSMFYLAAYGFINLSFFLESWASADFSPSFRVKRWVGLVGFIATFAVMFKLDMLAMIAAFVVIGGVYAWLHRKQLALGTGDIWQSVWSSVVKTGLRRMAVKEDHIRNWKPNVLLFSGATDDRPHMLEFSKALAGRSGVITNFDLIEDPEAKLLYPKHKQAFSDEVLERFGIFGRRIHVQNVFKGIEGIASTFGFSGIEPNSVLMGWPRNTKDPVWFAEMTQRLIELDYNVLFLDYDERRGFGKREQIDLWWRGLGDNSELMLNLARFITSSPGWTNASIRVWMVNEENVESKLLRIRIGQLLESLRVDAEVQVINNATEKVPFYDLVKVHSADADLIFTGIPELAPGNVRTFAADTTELVSIIGTTLLVKASSQFDKGVPDQTSSTEVAHDHAAAIELEPLDLPSEPVIAQELVSLDHRLELSATKFKEGALEPLRAARSRMVDRAGAILIGMHDKAIGSRSLDPIMAGLEEIHSIVVKLRQDQEKALVELMGTGIATLLVERDQIMLDAPERLRVARKEGKRTQRIPWQKILRARAAVVGTNGVRDAFLEIGTQELLLSHRASTDLSHHVRKLVHAITASEHADLASKIAELKASAIDLVAEQKRIVGAMPEIVHHALRHSDRVMCNGIARASNAHALKKQHRLFTTRARRKEAEKVTVFNYDYALHWSRNNMLFQRQVDTANALTRVVVGIEDLSRNTTMRLRLDHLLSTRMHIERITAALERTTEALASKEPVDLKVDAFHLEEDLFFNPDQLTEELIGKVDELVSILPDEVDLIAASSLNALSEEQGEGVTTERIALGKIADHLVETHFVNPLQEKMSKLGRQLDRISAKVKGAADIMQDAISHFAEGKDKEGLEAVIARDRTDLAEASTQLEEAWNNFTSDLANDRQQLAEALEVRTLIEQATALHARIKVVGRRRGILLVLERIAAATRERVKKLGLLLESKERSVALAQFDKQHRAFQNEHVLVWDMMSKLTLRKDLSEKVPFHYQYLFSGKHLNVSRPMENRTREFEEAQKAIQRIRNGASGGIMVLGGALSGKSYFTEHLAKGLGEWNVLRVKAPPGGATTRKALTIAFQEATGSDSLLDQLLTTQRPGTIFILNDLEKWWSLEEGGQNAIDHLARMIDRHGARHFFLLNANLHAYALMKRTRSLPACLLSTILLSPMNVREIGEEVWTRHRAGGMDLYFDGDPIIGPGSRAMRVIVRRIHRAAKGNVGLALRIWLACIENGDDESIELMSPGMIEFPDLDNAAWKSLLHQLVLHRELSRARLYEIYRMEGTAWVDRQLRSLDRSGILEETSRKVYSLSPSGRPFVEAWLKELQILN